jgi:hypothetical protein
MSSSSPFGFMVFHSNRMEGLLELLLTYVTRATAVAFTKRNHSGAKQWHEALVNAVIGQHLSLGYLVQPHAWNCPQASYGISTVKSWVPTDCPHACP